MYNNPLGYSPRFQLLLGPATDLYPHGVITQFLR
jgi:hypothetical protein